MEGLAEGNCKAKGKQRHRSDAGFSRRSKAVGLGGQAAMGIASRGCLLLFMPPTFGGAGPHLQLTCQ